ncbi:hypothetical protein DVA67_027835 [Solirubrobacter sp. CPCC 204708]|uniref:Tat pathway signal sequence domain protein n=1 Tax=Solirubrobacter deserti TaxID=2282478 RepID=A0ABT4RK46_9ACTN|nr:hypothetical protein [Solirubrobacter deserti]MBE2319807.1 hypothetical protein [Solirubrobacter deserti]MDA0138711.1 hypothetical protein [Solirubrobacter deserti]
MRTRRELMADAGRLTLAGMAAGPALKTITGAASAAPVPARALPTGAGWTNHEYWTFADWALAAAEAAWDERVGFYGSDIRTSCAMLSAHAIAAQTRYAGGPTRNDARAKRMAEALVQAPPFKPATDGRSTGSTDLRTSGQTHTPGWTASPTTNTGEQHVSIDPKVAEALARAWLVRDTIGLSADTAALIVERIQSTAEGVFFRYPNIRLNQINWYLELYLWAAVTADDPKRWLSEFRDQLRRWCTGAEKAVAPWSIPNLGPSWNFHRDPLSGLDAAENIESNEYCNIILDSLSYLKEAKAHGLVLSTQQRKVLRAWSKRALPAYWTHAGYPNWDTGLFLRRWHLGRYWAWSLGGLFAIMLNDEQGDASDAATAKYLFDRALVTYTRWARLRGQAVPQTPTYPVRSQLTPNAPDMAARFVLLAARAVAHDVEQLPAKAPAAMYAYDPSIGRLTVTTSRYNTAILAQNNGAFPYGGLDLCRLSDADQRVAASIGGEGAANFGVIVSDGHRDVVASAAPRRRGGPAPMTMTMGPPGRVTEGEKYPDQPYAGPFKALEVTGERSGGGVTVRSTHAFRTDRITATWKVTRGAGRAALDVDAHFPSYGTDATITAVLETGHSRRLTAASGTIALDEVAYFYIKSAEPEAGYVVVPRAAPDGARTAVIRPGAQPAAPLPGPTLVIELARRDRVFRSESLQVSIAVASTAAEAAKVARTLR